MDFAATMDYSMSMGLEVDGKGLKTRVWSSQYQTFPKQIVQPWLLKASKLLNMDGLDKLKTETDFFNLNNLLPIVFSIFWHITSALTGFWVPT